MLKVSIGGKLDLDRIKMASEPNGCWYICKKAYPGDCGHRCLTAVHIDEVHQCPKVCTRLVVDLRKCGHQKFRICKGERFPPPCMAICNKVLECSHVCGNPCSHECKCERDCQER